MAVWKIGRFYLGCALLAPITFASALAQSADAKMTCEQFKADLAASIHRQGDKVAIPSDFEVAYSTPGDPHIRFTYAGIAGLSGDLNCAKGLFASFDIWTDLGAGDLRENGLRLIRSWSLSQAALCARGGMTDEACQSATLAIAKKAMEQFSKERDRGSEHPGGDQFENFANETQLDIGVTDGGTLISVTYWPKNRQ